MTTIINNKRIILSIIFSIFILSIFFYFVNKNNTQTTNGQKREISSNLSQAQFPLAKNSINIFSFTCLVNEVLYPNLDIKENKTIEIGVSCNYLDVNKKLQEIKVPLVLKNHDNTRIIEDRYINTDLPMWKTESYVHFIEESYYNRNMLEIYDEPNGNNYWHKNTKKPVMTPGDEVLISFTLKNNNALLPEELDETAEFSRSYHENIYSYKKIQEFITTGNPKLLNTEQNNWIIPSWVNFYKDNDPQ